MVGEGVLHECLQHNDVEKILVIGRRPCGVSHPKLTEIIHKDFFDLSPVEDQFGGYNACFFCLGTSSFGMKEEDYYNVTYTLTMHNAEVMSRRNPDMVFCYISGMGTDSTEKGKFMWARVKGKTENDLMKLPFKRVYGFRPGFMRPTKGLNNAPNINRAVGVLYPALRVLFPWYVTTLKELGIAMINTVVKGYDKKILEVKDILIMAKQA